MNKLLSYIQLINTEKIGPVTFYRLLEDYGSAEKAIENISNKFKIYPKKDAVRQLDLAKLNNVEIISFDDKKYPVKLKELNDAPPILYAKGNISLLNHQISIAIIGARNASINGRKTIAKFAFELTNENILIISGMARGIDTSAHKGAIHSQNKQGPTIAVVGTGVDVIYPVENTQLYEKICEQGLVISEFILGTTPKVQNFPRRNRIISALSNGVLVGEASIKSGSLITARLGLEQGKDIFAIPGNPDDFRSSGPNKLIKDGAILVENIEDIIQNLNISSMKKIKLPIKKNNISMNSLDITEKIVNIQKQNSNSPKVNLLELIDINGIHIDEIIRHSKLRLPEVMIGLLELEMAKKITKKIGNIYVLVK